MSQSAKAELRRVVRVGLSALAPVKRAARSTELVARLSAYPSYRAALCVLAYLALPDEPDLDALIEQAWRDGKRVAVPRVDWEARSMVAAQITSLTVGVTRGPHGVRLPPADAPHVPAGEIDVALIPGVAFDGQGRRLGRGGGFYDRYLAQPDLTVRRIGVAFEEQIVAAVPTEPWDVPMQAVVTNRAVREIAPPVGERDGLNESADQRR